MSEEPRDLEDESAEEANWEEPEEESETDPYAVLGLSTAASAEEVRQSYFRLVRRYPPETHPERFKLVRAAYEALKSPLRRAQREVAQLDLSVDQIELGRLDSPINSRSSLVAALLAVELAESEFASDGSSSLASGRWSSESDVPTHLAAPASDLTPIDERDLPV